eukprot:TRINITY_DN260_c0_g1_i1.p1 TRINITY_DN260_c0_g1~~TRINITY_DN260_c0_g1_i1.p1  ORF type:complete len:431 (+),score=116.48 TRINITY_DN260_c0_g1_i1:104-1294(+)
MSRRRQKSRADGDGERGEAANKNPSGPTGVIAVVQKRRASAVMRHRLMELADRAAALRYHQGYGRDGTPIEHPLRLTSLCSREIIDERNAGKVLHEYDGAGTYYCRMCIALRYGIARHCATCVPPFDLCVQCFHRVQNRERAEDMAERGLKRANVMLRKPTETKPEVAHVYVAPPTVRECLADASRGEYQNLIKVLFPKPRSAEDLAAEAARLSGRPQFDFAAADRETGRTFLHYAAEAGRGKVVFGLLMRYKKEGKGDVDDRDRSGMTPLMLGAMRGRTKVVEELLYSDANMEIVCHKRYNALMLAACYGHDEVVSRLLHGGAEVNRRSLQGRTALAMACLNGNYRCARILLSFPGCDCELQDDEGYTPVLLAAAKGHHNIVQLFPRRCQQELRW